MKKILLLLITLSFIPLSYAQPGPKKEKIKALKTAHITNELNLSKAEAEKFWPIYNTAQEKEHSLRKRMRELQDKVNNDISEKEAQVLIDKFLNIFNETHATKTQLMVDLKKILPAKKIIALKKAEETFKRKLLKEFRDRRRPPGGGPGPR